MPDVDHSPGERLVIDRRHATGHDKALPRLVGSVRQLVRRLQDRGAWEVVRAEDRSHRARPIFGRLPLDSPLDERIEHERPLARFADVDQPLLCHLVLVVVDVVLGDDISDALEDLADYLVAAVTHESPFARLQLVAHLGGTGER